MDLRFSLWVRAGVPSDNFRIRVSPALEIYQAQAIETSTTCTTNLLRNTLDCKSACVGPRLLPGSYSQPLPRRACCTQVCPSVPHAGCMLTCRALNIGIMQGPRWDKLTLHYDCVLGHCCASLAQSLNIVVAILAHAASSWLCAPWAITFLACLDLGNHCGCHAGPCVAHLVTGPRRQPMRHHAGHWPMLCDLRPPLGNNLATSWLLFQPILPGPAGPNLDASWWPTYRF